MKRVGIYSGSCDPLHFGHLWVIEQGVKLFDEFHVVIGSHAQKQHLFNKHERLKQVRASSPWKNIHFDVLGDNNNIIEYVKKIPHECEKCVQFTLLRGIRNPKDTTYEAGIAYQIKKLSTLPSIFVLPPPELTNISSTKVRECAEKAEWDLVAEMVPEPVLNALIQKFGEVCEKCRGKGGRWDTESIDHWYTCDECVGGRKRQINCQSVNGHQMDLEDKPIDFPCKNPVHDRAQKKMRDNFEKLASLGFVQFPKEVMALQVRAMLDPFPYDVVVSQKFYLKRININSVKPLGKRYIPSSQSLGPIIVDANEVLGDESSLGELGPVIVIEGKHRWLDAKEAGETKILAYVGEKALNLVEQ